MYNYTDEQLASIKKVEATRSERLNNLFPRMSADEKDAVLKENHPDYIQSAYEMPTEEKLRQEKRSLIKVGDSLKKIVVVKDNIRPRIDEDGIVTMGLLNFLLDQKSLDL